MTHETTPHETTSHETTPHTLGHSQYGKAETRVVLGEAVRLSREEAIREMDAIRRSLEGRYTGDPVAEIRAERDRRS